MTTRSLSHLARLALLSGSMFGVVGCDSLREALTAHTDVVAKAESQELSVDRLSNLLGTSALQIVIGVWLIIFGFSEVLRYARERPELYPEPPLSEEVRAYRRHEDMRRSPNRRRSRGGPGKPRLHPDV